MQIREIAFLAMLLTISICVAAGCVEGPPMQFTQNQTFEVVNVHYTDNMEYEYFQDEGGYYHLRKTPASMVKVIPDTDGATYMLIQYGRQSNGWQATNGMELHIPKGTLIQKG
jgi:hypothetical protein